MNKMFKNTVRLMVMFSFLFFSCRAQQGIPHLSAVGNTKQLIVDGKPFIMLGGELHNSSASSPEYMRSIWKGLKSLNLNTVLASVTWEMVEPKEGTFDFLTVDSLIAAARKHELKLVFLWFGTWKNACSSYTPEWVRRDTKRFFRSQSADGIKLNNISSLCSNACEADAKAFSMLMKHIREADEKENTVLTIQVENESGIRGNSRDRSAEANEAIKKNVPADLMKFLIKNKEQLNSEFKEIWATSNYKTKGTWQEIFGVQADLLFMTWNTAKYIDKVAAAGKKEYPLPMYANAWIEWDGNKPGDYPSGGPIAKMIPVWKAAAPNIDILAPDIYQPDFAQRCELHRQMGNPLFIPEVMPDILTVANVFYAIGQSTICYSPFAIDNIKLFPADHRLQNSYQLLLRLMPYLQKYQATGKMAGILGTKNEKKEIELGQYRLLIDFFGNEKPDLPGFGLVIALNDDEFLVSGSGFTVTFLSKPGMPKRTEILSAYELIYQNNEWVKQRRLNGDETGPGSDHNIQLRFEDNLPTVKTAKVFSYD